MTPGPRALAAAAPSGSSLLCLGPSCRGSRAFALRTMLLPNILLTGQGARGQGLAGGAGDAERLGLGAADGGALRVPCPGWSRAAWGGSGRALATFAGRGRGRGASLLVAPGRSVRGGEVNPPAPLPGKLPVFLDLLLVCEMDADIFIFLDRLWLAARSC